MSELFSLINSWQCTLCTITKHCSIGKISLIITKKTLIKIKNISIEAPVIDKYDDIENYLLNNKEITKLGN